MNVNKVLTRNYENKTLGGRGKNKANSKPIKANFQKAAMFVTTFLTKNYENIPDLTLFENKPNTNPNKPNFTILPTPKGLQQRAKNCLLKISCLMAQGFLCCGLVFLMLWIKKEFFGKNVQ